MAVFREVALIVVSSMAITAVWTSYRRSSVSALITRQAMETTMATMTTPALIAREAPVTTMTTTALIAREAPVTTMTTTALITREAPAIALPVPELLADMQGRQINMQDAHNASIKSPAGDAVIVVAFSPEADRHVSKALLTKGGWETNEIMHMYKTWQLAGKKGNFLDLGTNVGSWSLPIASALQSAGRKVISIEATPPIADHFRAGVVANQLDNVIFFGYAVGPPLAANDSRTVQMALDPSNKGGTAVVGQKGSKNKNLFTIGLSTLDEMLQVVPEMANVLYAKADIEGYEGRALAGGQQLFGHSPPCALYIEIRQSNLAKHGDSVQNVQAKLSEFGYNIAGGKKMGSDFEYRQTDYEKCVSRLH